MCYQSSLIADFALNEKHYSNLFSEISSFLFRQKEVPPPPEKEGRKRSEGGEGKEAEPLSKRGQTMVVVFGDAVAAATLGVLLPR